MRGFGAAVVIAAVVAAMVWWFLPRSDQAAPVEPGAVAPAVGSATPDWQSRPSVRPITPSAFQESAAGVDLEAASSKEDASGSRRDPTVQIVVRDGDENKPLESYGVRCFPPPDVPARDPRGDLTRLRESGVHPGGVLELRGIARGPQLLIVEADGDAWAPAGFVEFEMTASGAPRQEITVRRSVEKTVRVRRKDGTPVAGTKIEIVRRVGDAPIDESTESVFAQHLRSAPLNACCCLALGETEEEGELQIAGPPGQALVLRVLGPGHPPVIRDVDFGTSGAVIDVTVPDGATLVGRITPHEILAQLDNTGWGNEASSTRLLTGVRLARRRARDDRSPLLTYPLSRSSESGQHRGEAPLEEDGGFRIVNVPAGRWEVQLRHEDALCYDQDARTRVAISGWLAIGVVDLVDGAERQQTFELGHMLKADVEGIVTLDGKPLESGIVTFEAGAGAGAERTDSQAPIQAGGKFHVRLWPAEYRMLAQFMKDGRLQRMHDANRLNVTASQKLATSFDLRSSLLELRVLGSDGKTPVEGVELQVAVPDSGWPCEEKTDARGFARIEGLPALEVAVRVWPKQLATYEARFADRLLPRLRRLDRSLKNQDDALITVKTIVITPPETAATIVLPKSTGY